jgi:hypothetical protein
MHNARSKLQLLPVIRVALGRDGQCLEADVARRIGRLDQTHCAGDGARATGTEKDQRR